MLSPGRMSPTFTSLYPLLPTFFGITRLFHSVFTTGLSKRLIRILHHSFYMYGKIPDCFWHVLTICQLYPVIPGHSVSLIINSLCERNTVQIESLFSFPPTIPSPPSYRCACYGIHDGVNQTTLLSFTLFTYVYNPIFHFMCMCMNMLLVWVYVCVCMCACIWR